MKQAETPGTKRYLWILAGLIVVYALVGIGLPPDPATLAKYHLSAAQLRLLSLTVILPLAAIWWAIFYGFSRLKAYARVVRKTPEGRGFTRLANGLMIFAFGMPIAAIIGRVLDYWALQSPGVTTSTIIFNNYCNVVISLIAFGLMHSGAKRLLAASTARPRPETYIPVCNLVLLALGVSFMLLVFSNPYRQISSLAGQRPVYGLSDSLLLLTVVVPYVYIWCLGLRAAFYLNFYQRHVAGVLYRRSLRLLAWGVAAVVLGSVCTQYLTGASNHFANLNLSKLLLLVYGFLVVISIGFILIARGANKLRKIEEIV